MGLTIRQRPDPIPGIEWELTTRCNYDCSYCTQRSYAGLHWGDCSDKTIDAVLSVLKHREGSWLVKLSGGEPFLHPRFIEITERLTRLSHRVATTTNFSVPQRVLERFLEAAGPNLDYLTASLHLEQVRDVEEFFTKAAWFQSAKPAKARFVVTTVGIESDLPKLRPLADRLMDAGIQFEVAPRKEGMEYATYKDPEFVAFMERHALTNVEQIKGRRILGTICHTGSLFARITIDGDVLRCYNYQPRFALGNVVRGDFQWLEGPKPCLARECTCTVPANRNMIEYGNRAPLPELAQDALHAVWQHGPASVRLMGRWGQRWKVQVLRREG
jgi:MoaA/NifB/PqqE/SkfB family radical SAM enzyme